MKFVGKKKKKRNKKRSMDEGKKKSRHKGFSTQANEPGLI
jgi:hypothetical protein